MPYKMIPLTSLVVNPANDRHGELENETAAIAQLFATQDKKMRNLARDLVVKGEVFEPPLVFPQGKKFCVADGNRRTTCMKILSNPRKAPTVEIREFFTELKRQWEGKFPEFLECRVEKDRDRVDDILFRRHTGTQGGIGQSNWDDRMQNNFVLRTGKEKGVNLADEIEKKLTAADLLPSEKIPRSNLNRLLSSEVIRNRVGVSVKKKKFAVIRDEQQTLQALARIANDLATQRITLEKIWDTESKLNYIERLDSEGILPSASSKAPAGKPKPKPANGPKPKPPKGPKPRACPHLIENFDYEIAWTAKLQRHRDIWRELQYELELSKHRNAISVLLRVLIELSVDNYITAAKLSSVHENDKLSKKAIKVAEDMLAGGSIDKKYLGEIKKLTSSEAITSIDTLNRYVHSTKFSVSPEHLKTLWETLSSFVVLCLQKAPAN